MTMPFHVEAFLDNDSETFTYVVHDIETREAAVIDPVLDFDYKSGRTSSHSAQQIADYIDAEQLSVQWVLETHAHADHLSAAPFFKQRYAAKIGIGEHITEVQKTFKTLFNLEKAFLPNGAQFDRLFKDDDQLTLGNLTFRVVHTPGHTPADLAYVLNEQAVFVGDTMFMPDVGTARCDFPGGSAGQLYDSIQKLLSLPDSTDIYICHDYPPKGRQHECKTTVKAQRENNIHVKQEITRDQFISMRESRDATLDMPRLILPAIQLNIRAGDLPPADDNGTRYLKIPINAL
ncbi:MBL fold metallo-hydrolase [Aestuariibacter salexigens]|uniref:MBL fold metallo-hydrolase n=1 Tax=Aestuariibacter salexigens TaxID=226010 RepID=UPI000411A4CA|nr:MBL fold metallo-hydrolase [Aestuariibacter salexigens]